MFRSGPWEPTLDSWEKWEKETRAAFDVELRAHRYKIEKFARSRGYEEISQRRVRVHYEWLARYQLKKDESPFDIANTPGQKTEPDTVYKAVVSLARTIGLSLRKRGRGRPPGSKDRKRRRPRTGR